MLKELIKFRSLADSLADQEFETFLSRLYNKFSKRQLILKSLFHLFNAQCNHDQHENNQSHLTVAETMDIIRTIIRSRDKDFKQITIKKKQIKELSISNLSSDLIGFCASYLDFTSYKSFERCSRHIYLSCNNPNTLQMIDSNTFIKNYENVHHLLESQPLQLLKYRKVDTLEINMVSYMDMPSLHEMPLSQNITNLALLESNQHSLAQFLSMENCNFKKIMNLRLYYYDFAFPDQDDFSSDIQKYVKTFADLLMKCKNIKYLDLNELSVDIPEIHHKLMSKFDDDQFRSKILNKLEAFHFHCQEKAETDFVNDILHYYSDKLVSLHINASIAAPINGFSKLRELCLGRANHVNMKSVIKSATNLQRIHLEFFAEEVDSLSQENKKHLETHLVALLNQNSLKYVSICINRNIDIILKALRIIDLKDRDHMRVFFGIGEMTDKALKYLDTLQDKLKMSDKDYVLKMSFVGTENMTDKIKERIEHTGRYQELENPVNGGKFTEAVWTNGRCKLNGYRERWMYKCFCNHPCS